MTTPLIDEVRQLVDGARQVSAGARTMTNTDRTLVVAVLIAAAVAVGWPLARKPAGRIHVIDAASQ